MIVSRCYWRTKQWLYQRKPIKKLLLSIKKNVKASKATTKKNATKKSTAKAGIKFNIKPVKK